MTHIRHVTLTTGRARDSRPVEVDPAAIQALQPVIASIVSGDVSEPVSLSSIADVGPYSISGRGSSRCLVAGVYHDGPPSQLVCSIGVAAHSRCGAALWRNLHIWGELPVATDPERCPPEPWVAAALDAGALSRPDAIHWLGDFERCLAWAWLAYINA